MSPNLSSLRLLTEELALPGLYWGTAEVGERAELFLPERQAIARAVPKRQMEFLAGRIAVRRALARMGRPAEAIAAGRDRAPVWPAGICGSISHAEGLAVAVLAEAPAEIGVDIEADAALDDALISEICRPEERALVPRLQQGRFARRLFSAKEALYKAQYPKTRLIFGFHALCVDLEKGQAEYTDHRDLATLGPESRRPLPVAQRHRDGLTLSLSIRFG